MTTPSFKQRNRLKVAQIGAVRSAAAMSNPVKQAKAIDLDRPHARCLASTRPPRCTTCCWRRGPRHRAQRASSHPFVLQARRDQRRTRLRQRRRATSSRAACTSRSWMRRPFKQRSKAFTRRRRECASERGLGCLRFDVITVNSHGPKRSKRPSSSSSWPSRRRRSSRHARRARMRRARSKSTRNLLGRKAGARGDGGVTVAGILWW